MSTQTPHSPSTSSSSTPFSSLGPSPFVPSVRTKQPTHKTPSSSSSSSSSSSPSSRAAASTSSPFHPGKAYSDPTPRPIYAPSPASYPSNDPVTQDFDFDDLFTFANHSHPTILPTHPLSSRQPPSQPSPPNTKTENSTNLTSQPRPKLRNWSKFSFSHYNNNSSVSVPRSAKSTGTVKPRR